MFATYSFDSSLSPVLDTVLDAVVLMSTDGLIVGWNGVAENIFGWSASEAHGRPLGDLIVPEQHRQAHREGLKRLAAGGEAHVLNRRIEITALRRDGREIPIELSITTAPSASGAIFVGFIRDISERREVEAGMERQARVSRVLFEITSMAAESGSFEDALRTAIEAICEITGWPVGHAFVIPSGNPNVLRSSGIWVEAEAGVAKSLRDATDAIVFGPGVGLPGIIINSGEPRWVCDTDAEVNFPRKGKGFRGAFGFPLKHKGRLIAILEFFSKSEAAPDPAVLLTVRTLGEQVGRVFERMRTQDQQRLLIHELNHRVKNILSVVQAIAHQTIRKATSTDEAFALFSGRLRAVAHAQDVLVSDNAESATLSQLIDAELRGTGVSTDRVTVIGPEVKVSARNAVTISLAIHELCTNAFKYGALSVEDGSVCITWQIVPDLTGPKLHFEWRETGGPPVAKPSRKGFGSTLLEHAVASELGGKMTIEYPRQGIICRFVGSMPAPA
jgi:PAS domain S-box-containing protein